jgi:heat shock protein HslJ
MASPLRPVATLAASALLLACGPAEGLDLEGRSFLSTSVTESGAPRALVPGTRLRLTFHEGEEVSASAGCNPFGGHYEVDGGTLVVTHASEGLIGCDPELGAQDSWYFGFLVSKPSIAVDGDALVLERDGTRIEYLDQEVATPDVALTGVTWTVDTIIEGELAQHAEWPSPATLEFADDGTVEVYTGCNGGSGTYAVAGAELTFADVAVSERGCEEPTGQLEHVVLGVIHGPQPVTWEITADRLSLRGQGFGLELVASAG